MSKHYYLSSSNGLTEVTEEEWVSLIGEDTYRDYIFQVYENKITLDEVPEEYRELVSNCVDKWIARNGMYKEQEISSDELGSMIENIL